MLDRKREKHNEVRKTLVRLQALLEADTLLSRSIVASLDLQLLLKELPNYNFPLEVKGATLTHHVQHSFKKTVSEEVSNNVCFIDARIRIHIQTHTRAHTQTHIRLYIHTHTHTHTHTPTPHTHTHTHTHTRTHARTHALTKHTRSHAVMFVKAFCLILEKAGYV